MLTKVVGVKTKTKQNTMLARKGTIGRRGNRRLTVMDYRRKHN
jgi:hypothetical protein